MERRIGRCRSDVIYDTILFILLSLVFLVVAYPLYFVIISSVSDPIAVSNGEVTFYPIGFTLDGYREVFKTNTVVRGFLNSLLYTVCGSIYIESLYSIPGMGGLLVEVISLQDNPMVQALVMIFSCIGIVGLLIGDLLMAAVDPRISFVKKEGSR